MFYRSIVSSVQDLGPRQALARIMTGARANDGHILVPTGVILDAFRRNSAMLRQHDPRQLVGTWDNLDVHAAGIDAIANFAPAGISAVADETCGLVKSGHLKGVSIGFEMIEAEPIDPKNPRGGMRATRWELFEASWVAVGADSGALVLARQYRGGVAAPRGGPLECRTRREYEDWRQDHCMAVTLAACRESDFDRRQREARELRNAS
jgi:HK97 family phage prohead protease